MNSHRETGFTLVEGIVCVVVAVVMFGVILPAAYGTSLTRAILTQTLSNMKQLHLATQQMALDSDTTGIPKAAWPGDMNGSFARWASTMVPNYIATNDFCKLMSTQAKTTPPGHIPLCNTNGILAYAVSKTSEGPAIFLSSANFTNTAAGGMPLSPDAQGDWKTSFVVFHQGGDGAVLLSTQIGHTNVIGTYVPLCR